MLSYFIVGRLFARHGVDCLFPVLLPMGLGCLYPSWSSTFRFLQHSFSMYEIMCRWSWQLFVYAFVVSIIGSSIIVLHIQEFHRQGILVSRLMEVGIVLTLFLIPYAGNASFHFHHWYAAWMIGMHANVSTWWSIATLTFMWGTYINGIAVYGRDPILSCAYSFYVSTNIHCDYMSCYTNDDNGHPGYKPYIAPDWRNCSAGHYHF